MRRLPSRSATRVSARLTGEKMVSQSASVSSYQGRLEIAEVIATPFKRTPNISDESQSHEQSDLGIRMAECCKVEGENLFNRNESPYQLKYINVRLTSVELPYANMRINLVASSRWTSLLAREREVKPSSLLNRLRRPESAILHFYSR